jgi:hypothetical protein
MIDFVDYYIEEIYHLARNSKNDVVNKTKILGIFHYHVKNCNLKKCMLNKELLFMNDLDLNLNVVTSIIKDLFV